MPITSQITKRVPTLALLAFVTFLAACSAESSSSPLGIERIAPARAVLPALPSEVRAHAVSVPEVAAPAPSGMSFATMSSVVPTTATSYAITIDPRKYQAIAFGPHMLSVPANTLCDLKTVTTGTGSCKKATRPVSVTISVWTDAAGKVNVAFDKPLRFAPNSTGQLPAIYIYDPAAAASTTSSINSCTSDGVCSAPTTESDKTLQDPSTGYVYRSLDYFSGYNVWA